MKYTNYIHIKLMINALFALLTKKWNSGFCPVCNRLTIFVIIDNWLRDYYRCIYCLSIPRQRALKIVLDSVCPDWKSKSIHESSPSGPLSKTFARNCNNYIGSQFYPNLPPGTFVGKYLNQNLENQTFPDLAFDIVITQDVFEHILHPQIAFIEIARTLKPGGIHIFTVPITMEKRTESRVIDNEGVITYIKPKEYHRNPVDSDGSLVITDWGYDIKEVIRNCSNMDTTIYNNIDKRHGIEGEYLDVLVCTKSE